MPRTLLRLAAAALTLAAAGCTGKDAVSQSVSGLGWIQGDSSTRWLEPGDRPDVRDVTGRLLDGTRFDLSQWRGHVVVVNFWGSWCAPCRDEADALQAVYAQQRSSGVRFLGVDVRDDRPSAEAFVRSHHVTYPSLFDESNEVALAFRGVPPNATPTTVVLDRDGRIAARHSGAILYTTLRALVAHVSREPS